MKPYRSTLPPEYISNEKAKILPTGRLQQIRTTRASSDPDRTAVFVPASDVLFPAVEKNKCRLRCQDSNSGRCSYRSISLTNWATLLLLFCTSSLTIWPYLSTALTSISLFFSSRALYHFLFLFTIQNHLLQVFKSRLTGISTLVNESEKERPQRLWRGDNHLLQVFKRTDSTCFVLHLSLFVVLMKFF